MIPITAISTVSSDKSAELDNMREGNLLRTEKLQEAKIAGAQAIGGITSKIVPSIDAAFGAEKNLRDTQAAIDTQTVDQETLNELYKKAPSDISAMKEYAKTRLKLNDADLAKYDPLIRSVMQDSKKTRDPGSIFRFYDMIDKTAAAQEEADAKKKKAVEDKNLLGTKSDAGAFISAASDAYQEEVSGFAPTQVDLTNWIMGNSEWKSKWDALKLKDDTALSDAITKQLSATARISDNRDKTVQDAALKLNEKLTASGSADIAKRTVDIVANFPKQIAMYKNLQTAIDTATLTEADKKSAGKDGSAVGSIKAVLDNIKARLQLSTQKYLEGSDSLAAGIIAEAALPENIKVALESAAKTNGPLWQLLITHLRNTSGAAVTDGEYARFAKALGLVSANPDERMESISYFLGNGLAAMSEQYQKALSSQTGVYRSELKKSGARLPEFARSALEQIRLQGETADDETKKWINAVIKASRTLSPDSTYKDFFANAPTATATPAPKANETSTPTPAPTAGPRVLSFDELVAKAAAAKQAATPAPVVK